MTVRNRDSIFSTSLPSFSLSAAAFFQSGSAPNSLNDFARASLLGNDTK